MKDYQTLNEASTWFLYIIRCSDDSLYTGITTDVERRLREHNGEKGKRASAAYTRARRPVALMYQEEHADRACASRREFSVKKMSRAQKLELIDNQADKAGPMKC